MTRTILLGLQLTLVVFSAFAQLPKVSSGTIKRLDSFASKYVKPRNVDIWLPEGYNESKKYAVLYMHDGQMLFDSTITWNKQEWKIDETVSDLMKDQKIRSVIVVGIWNRTGYRHTEYFPEKPLKRLSRALQDTLYKNELKYTAQSDNYLRFLVKELKPYIDSHFSTYGDRANTFIGGSSMGGLISLYAICEYPRVFGGAACISTHWPGSLKDITHEIPAAFNEYLKKHLPSPKNHKIYFDYGTATLDSLYEPYQLVVNETMKQKGYDEKRWITAKFPGADHSERSWQKRMKTPLEFLLGYSKQNRKKE